MAHEEDTDEFKWSPSQGQPACKSPRQTLANLSGFPFVSFHLLLETLHTRESLSMFLRGTQAWGAGTGFASSVHVCVCVHVLLSSCKILQAHSNEPPACVTVQNPPCSLSGNLAQTTALPSGGHVMRSILVLSET